MEDEVIKSAELDREYATKEALFADLKANESRILDVKKSNIYKSVDKGQFSPTGSGFMIKDDVVKAAYGFDSNYIYPVINTTRYMDTHKDVHFDGLWKKSVADKQGKITYVDSHDFAIKSVIAWEEDVEMFLKMIPWALVGKNYDGETEALIYKIHKDKISESYKKIVTDKRKVQNSVRMSYVNVKMAINSNEKDYALNKQVFDEFIDKIANKDVAKKYGYFFAVTEARIEKEGSMVLSGSNDATAIIYDGAAKKHSQTEPPKGTHKAIDYEFLAENLKM